MSLYHLCYKPEVLGLWPSDYLLVILYKGTKRVAFAFPLPFCPIFNVFLLNSAYISLIS